VIAYVLKETPFIALVALAMLRRTTGDYELVAATLGASAWQRFRYVTLPLVAPSVVSAALLVFAFISGHLKCPLFGANLSCHARRGGAAEVSERGSDGPPGAIAVAVLMTFVSGGAGFCLPAGWPQVYRGEADLVLKTAP